jgi:GNAT superfamily N-acetyltransferase
MTKIVLAETADLIQHAQDLSKDYIAWVTNAIQEHYPDVDIRAFIGEHDYDEHGADFPGECVPPFGRLLVALHMDQPAGCVALAKYGDGVCEMRTLFVRPDFHGMGIGRQLVESVLKAAHEIGYKTMRLDTLALMQSALNLYYLLGFRDIPPYREVSGVVQQYICFLELDLNQ